MFGVTDIWAFSIAVLLFLLLPGPGTFAVLTSSAQGGVRGGYAALFGLMLGDVILIIAALTGVAALLATRPDLFHAVQYLGVAYLIWVGLQLPLRPGKPAGATLLPIRNANYFRQGFLITLINPKAIVFYMAFFPLFIDPQRHQGLVTFGCMMLIIAAQTLAYGSLLIFAGDGLARGFRSRPKLGQLASRLAGTALIAFGIRLAKD
jgi:leucine efflux protein